jgi:hypothetical protein
MSELIEALNIARRLIDTDIDPDGDLCVLARQFIRAYEANGRLSARIEELEKLPEKIPPEQQLAFILRALEEGNIALSHLARVAIQTPRDDNHAMRGNIALGLRRAAAYTRGERYIEVPDPQHVGNKGT